MKGMPFNAQIEGALEEVVQRRRLFSRGRGGLGAEEEEEEDAIFWVSKARGCGGGGRKEGSEPRSVLDRRRSPSPPTSSSTLSSSLGGGGGGGGASDVAAVPDNNPPAAAHQWPLSGPLGGGGGASELPPMTATAAAGVGHEMGFVGGGGERCGLGLGGGDEWEAMLSGSAAAGSAAAAVPEQSFLRWIMGDAGEGGAGNAAPGFGFVDHPSSFGLELIGAFGSASAVSHPPPHPHPHPHPLASNVSSSGGFSPTSSNNSINKIPSFGNQIAESLLSPLPAALLHDPMEEKPQLFGPSGLLLNPLHQQQPHAPPSPGFFVPAASSYAAAHVEHQLLLPPRPKRHHYIPGEPTCPIPIGGAGPELFLRHSQFPPQPQNSGFPCPQPVRHDAPPRPMKPKAAAAAAGHEAAAAAAVAAGVGLHPQPPPPLPQQQQQQQAVADQLIEAAKMVEGGDAVSARGILARLNQLLPAPVGKPLLRSAFYFKEALRLVLSHSPAPLPNSPSPLDVVFKLSAYKAFSEVSPVLHFTNFTCVQALLEELGATDRISVIDFDIGVGGHWSSFMQELAQRRRCTAAGSAPALKITAFISPSSHHPLELHLVRENLSRFAADLDIPFEFNFLTLESFHPSDLLSVGDEAIAVNLPPSSSHDPSFPTLLRLVKQLAPKVVVSVDHGFDRCDLPFASHFLCALQSHVSLLDSIDASGASFDVADKIERFLLQPRIETALLGAHRVAEKMPHWKTLFLSAGFAPVQFSNFTETQAECLLKRVQVRGFHVEKRQASLSLYWQRRELVSVSAWRC